ncbi:hypothetical protein QJQ45_013963 [Haematococcus lacustris]|nr:hypothetical protein QJQ45_013963 [Haematococcus lacustris]
MSTARGAKLKAQALQYNRVRTRCASPASATSPSQQQAANSRQPTAGSWEGHQQHQGHATFKLRCHLPACPGLLTLHLATPWSYCSTSLRANDMWTNTIGLEQDPQAGSNSVIEAQIYAPTHGGGGKRTERRELAQQLIQASEWMEATAPAG